MDPQEAKARELPRCCNEPVCPRKELGNLLTPGDSIDSQVERLAIAVAQTCRNLSEDDLRTCFSEFFKIGPECVLFEQFRESYRRKQPSFKAASS